MTSSMVYITARDKQAALSIGRTLVEERLAACVNVLDGMTSIYRWQERIEQSTEAILIAKTKSSLVKGVVARVKELHSYDCPCVVAWRLEEGNPPYLQWIEQETR